MEAQADNLLKRLVDQERMLAERVEQAQQESVTILDEAKRKAEALLADASTNAQRASDEMAVKAAQEAEEERQNVLSAAHAAAAAISADVDARRNEAVRVVMERVLP